MLSLLLDYEIDPISPFSVDKPVNNQDLDEKERKRLSNQRYYGKHRGQIKEKRRVLAQDTNINAHEKFMNKKRYHENKPKPMKNYIDIEHQSECKIGICATFVHPSKIKKRKRNQRYYNTHKERLMEKRRTATDESAKSHDRFMSKRRYFLAKNMQFEDADHQMMCNIGICAGFVPSLMPKNNFS